MEKYRVHDKLTGRQQEEVAFLTNAGVIHKAIATTYGTAKANVRRISSERNRWLSEDEIAVDKLSQYHYAQELYSDDIRPRVRILLEREVLTPIAAQAAKNVKHPMHNYNIFFNNLFQDTPSLPEYNKRRKKELDWHKKRVQDYALSIIKKYIDQGWIYETVEDVLIDVVPEAEQSVEAAIGSDVQANRRLVRDTINQAFAKLTEPRRVTLERFYGLGCEAEGLPQIGQRREVSKDGKVVSRARVGQIKDAAFIDIKRFAIKQLEELVTSKRLLVQTYKKGRI